MSPTAPVATGNTRRRDKHLVVGILLFVFAIYLGAALIGKDKNHGINGPRESESSTAPKIVAPAPRFDIKASKVPEGFAGDDMGQIYSRLSAIAATRTKSDFETTAQFHQRIEQDRSMPIAGPRTLGSTYVFEIGYPRMSYDADTQMLSLFVDLVSVWTENSLPDESRMATSAQTESTHIESVGQNGFGMKRSIDVDKSESYEITFRKPDIAPQRHSANGVESLSTKVKMSAGEANQLETELRALIVCNLTAPYATVGHAFKSATIDDPTEFSMTAYYVHVKPLQIWFYNGSSGQVVSKLNFKGMSASLTP